MFLPDGPGGDLVLSARDLRTAAACEFALLAELDVALGRSEPLATTDDPMLARLADLGNAHEQRELLRLRRDHHVVQPPAAPTRSRTDLEAACAATLDALRSDAGVIFQATLFDGSFLGLADFLVRDPSGGWVVTDTKLARREDVAALLQVGAYADVLGALDVPVADRLRLVLGTGAASEVPTREVLPVARARRRRAEELTASHREGQDPVAWGTSGVLACGRCDACSAAAERERDLVLVAGMRPRTRAALHKAGVTTIDDLAVRVEPVPGVGAERLGRLAAQARLQVARESADDGVLPYEVFSPTDLGRLPAPSAGDLFFDFEGDPMWAEPGSDVWGLEYLWGFVDVENGTEEPRFTALWAHDRAGERQALRDFLGHVVELRGRYPGMHVYHYSPYETAALKRLSVRYGECEQELDDLLRAGVFVDLYPAVKAAVRVGSPSYSIKKLEPLYMGDQLRDDEGVTGGAESIVEYQEYLDAVIAGAGERAEQKLERIAEYNEYDCVSTLRLRDWLLAHAQDPADAGDQVDDARASSEADSAAWADAVAVEARLRGLLGDVPPHERSAEQQALAMVAAAQQFHRRENKPFWWSHFERLASPQDEWADDTGVFVAERVEVVSDWARPSARSLPRRVLRLEGRALGSTPPSDGSGGKAVYTGIHPPNVEPDPRHLHSCDPTLVVRGSGHEDGHDVLLVEESLKKGCPEHDALPTGFVPGPPIGTRAIDAALVEIGAEVAATWPDLPRSPGVDLLRRIPPRTRSGKGLAPVGDGYGRYVDALVASLTDLDHSYLAVQGPPGTGKTYVASRVIARLVDDGWRIGVTSQGHAAITNVLRACAEAGVPREQLAHHPGGKAGDGSDPDVLPWTRTTDLAGFAADLRDRGRGYVVGGTAWAMTNENVVGRGELDLLVVDEAGQFSTAKTLACSVAADNLMLLGDPQQLPQVSQGTHPDPVDTSALGWLLGEHTEVIPPELGYFLETTWRMHPALTETVSQLAYAGALRAKVPQTSDRSLDGIAPGVHVVDVDHTGRTTASPEEAGAVVDLVRDLVGRPWTAAAGELPRPLEPSDVCIVAPFNAQVHTVRRALEDAGLDDVPVGTVDKFQGQEAPVAILTMASSAPEESSRGLAFVTDRHRLNVAISRGQWAAYVVRSPLLTASTPRCVEGLLDMGAFLAVCGE